MDWSLHVVLFGICFVVVAAAMWPLVALLRRRTILDHPNERSSHAIPTPRGGGLAVIPAILLAWLVVAGTPLFGPAREDVLVAVGAAAVLMAVSWLDDVRGLPVLLRLGTQAACVLAVLALLPAPALLLQGLLPLWADRLVTLLAWIWFINLFNFMDGIDGISAVETITIASGIVGVGLVAGEAAGLAPFAVALLAALAGFLLWNWHPARVFLGDVGSAPLGFLLGWLLIELAVAGEWVAALILPAYYLADATITLLRRAMRGEKFWQAHREHFYQRAVAAGLGHRRMSLLVFALGVLLAALAVVGASGHAVAALPLAAGLVAGFLAVLARKAGVGQ